MHFGTIVTVLSVGVREMGYSGTLCEREGVQRQSFNNNLAAETIWKRLNEILFLGKHGRYGETRQLYFHSTQLLLLVLNSIWIPTWCRSDKCVFSLALLNAFTMCVSVTYTSAVDAKRSIFEAVSAKLVMGNWKHVPRQQEGTEPAGSLAIEDSSRPAGWVTFTEQLGFKWPVFGQITRRRPLINWFYLFTCK